MIEFDLDKLIIDFIISYGYGLIGLDVKLE